jgi:protein-L-isoaspartate(D-aspartate) O-methyltransferase
MSEHDFSLMRTAMVASQLRPNGVTDPAVIRAFETVHREQFVLDERRRAAYVDIPVQLSSGRSMNAPLPTARLINDAGLKGGESLLLIGACTGYAAAILAQLNVAVTAVEAEEALFAALEKNVSNIATVKPVKGTFAAGFESAAPFDVILIDGAVEEVPSALVEQVKEGGMVLSGMIDHGVTRLCAGYRLGDTLSMQPFLDIGVVHLPGFAPPPAFRF